MDDRWMTLSSITIGRSLSFLVTVLMTAAQSAMTSHSQIVILDLLWFSEINRVVKKKDQGPRTCYVHWWKTSEWPWKKIDVVTFTVMCPRARSKSAGSSKREPHLERESRHLIGMAPLERDAATWEKEPPLVRNAANFKYTPTLSIRCNNYQCLLVF